MRAERHAVLTLTVKQPNQRDNQCDEQVGNLSTLTKNRGSVISS
jgi:hypothetical protein